MLSSLGSYDKNIISINETSLAGTQVSRALINTTSGTTYPCTLLGVRWSFCIQNTGAAFSNGLWMLVVVEQGDSPNTMILTTATTAYKPEQAVLAFGGFCSTSGSSASPQIVSGFTTSKRKLKAGDNLYFIALAQAGSTVAICGAVQYFLKCG